MQQPPQQPPSAPYGIYCNACGQFNHPNAATCVRCNAPLVRPPGMQSYYTPPVEARPGCVSAYAILLFIAAGLSLIGTLFGGLEGADAASIVVIFAGIGLNIALGIGLWQLKEWARVLLLVLLGLGMVGSLLFVLLMAVGIANLGPLDIFGIGDYFALLIFLILIGVAVSGYVFYWFAANKKYFR